MQLLLDTHIFLWAAASSNKLPKPVFETLQDNANDVYVSACSGWEIAIKYALGKIPLPAQPNVYVPSRIRMLNFQILPISLEHTLAVSGLPPHHDDPFDRLLVVQTQLEGLTFVTVDPIIKKYAVRTLNAPK